MSELTDNFTRQQPERETALSGLYLVRTYTHDSPFTTLSDIPLERAQEIMRENYNHVDDDNIVMRRSVQEWLREDAQRMDIGMERQNPIYFAVVKNLDDYKAQLPDGYNAICSPMDQVNLAGWTFTMDDSFISASVEVKGREYSSDLGEHALHGTVLRAADVIKYFESDHPDYEQKSKTGQIRQFEAQMWDQTPKMINSRECPVASFTSPPQPYSPHQ